MIRTARLLVLSALVPAAAFAQTPAGEDGRYTFNPADDGYVRLDGRTGAVSICSKRAVGWACRVVPDELAALEAEIARLQGENAALKKELITRKLPLPGAVTPEPPAAKRDEPQLQFPSDAEIDRLVEFIEKVWHRLAEAIVKLQKDILKGG